jgi:hypothetical protein
MFKWACLVSVAVLSVGCGDSSQSQTTPSANRTVHVGPDEIPRLPDDLKTHFESLYGKARLQARVLPEENPIQDDWRWEQQERLVWPVVPSDG